MDRAEIERSLTGAWRLFLNKPDAMRLFDVSADGFWRSFRAIFLILPFYIVTSAADRHDLLSDLMPDVDFSEGAFWFAKALTLCLDWVTLPIVLGLLSGFLGLTRGYPAYVTVRNWATVLTIIPFALISLIEDFGLIGPELLFLPSVVAFGAALRMSYLVARRAMQAAVDVSVALVLFDFLISLTLVMGIGRLFGIEPVG